MPTARRRRRLLLGAMGSAALHAMPGLLHAAPPDRPAQTIRLWVVYPPGGLSDAMARALARPLSQRLGVTVVVEHRAGAGGSVGIEALARAAPDGRTLAFSAISPLTLHPLLNRAVRDPLHAVMPVAGVMRTPVLVAGTRALPGHRFEDMLDMARREPGAVRWATSGVATIGHMVLAQVRASAGLRITHVPYQGGGPQLNDALGGQFEVLSTNLAAMQLQYVASGQLRALAVGAPARLDALPTVPTLAELGFASANLASLFGVFAPAGTPAATVQTLNAAIRHALDGAELQALLRADWNLPAAGSPEDFQREIDADRQRNLALVAAAGGQLD